jgi:hypothetical protein
MKSHPPRWFGCMRVNAESKEKYAALRRKRRRLRSVGLRPRAMGALRGLAALATPPTEKHPARCLRHSRIKGRLPTRVCLRRVGPTSLLPPPASPAPSALPAATSMASARKPPLNTARRQRTHRRPRGSRRADAPLRDACAGACWHPREATRSAPPLRRGAAARQFPPSLCRCACQPLRGPCTLDEPVCLGLCPSPRALGPGEGQGW